MREKNRTFPLSGLISKFHLEKKTALGGREEEQIVSRRGSLYKNKGVDMCATIAVLERGTASW